MKLIIAALLTIAFIGTTYGFKLTFPIAKMTTTKPDLPVLKPGEKIIECRMDFLIAVIHTQFYIDTLTDAERKNCFAVMIGDLYYRDVYYSGKYVNYSKYEVWLLKKKTYKFIIGPNFGSIRPII